MPTDFLKATNMILLATYLFYVLTALYHFQASHDWLRLAATKTANQTELYELCTHSYERKSIGTTYEAW